jgi:hypothetical protein
MNEFAVACANELRRAVASKSSRHYRSCVESMKPCTHLAKNPQSILLVKELRKHGSRT